MPVYNNFTGSWTLAVDNYMPPNVIFANNINHNYSLGISQANTIAGSGQTLIRNFSNINANIDINGPMLFSTNPEYPLVDGVSNLIGGASTGYYPAGNYSYCYDVYNYVKYKIAPRTTSPFHGINSINIKSGQEGVETSANWWVDPPSVEITMENDQASVPWMTNGAGLQYPLRQGTWYDYWVGTDINNVFITKDFNVDIKFEYGEDNILGGSRLLVYKASSGAIDISDPVEKSWWNHTPFRTLKNLNVTFTFTGLIDRYIAASTPPLFGETAGCIPSVNLTQQPSDMLYYNIIPGLDIYTFLAYRDSMRDGLIGSIINQFAEGMQSIGVYYTNIKNNIVPGLMTYTISGEYIIPIYGV
jgi:hypothetical protein